jgi:hypothetical protein
LEYPFAPRDGETTEIGGIQMSSHTQRVRALSLVLLIGSLLTTVGCISNSFRNIQDVAVQRYDSKPLTMTDMEHAIRLAAIQEEWQKADLAEPGHMVITKADDDSQRSMTVDVLFTTSQFSIKYKDSRGYHYDPASGRIDHHYLSMTDDLRGRIRDAVQQITPGA